MSKLIVGLFFLFSINLIAQDTIFKPKLSVISLDKVKVVYRGVDNPITVSIPNAKEYWVSGPGVSKTDEIGKYIVRPGLGNELKIVVAIKLENDSIVTEEHFYQIKGLPNPIPTLSDNYSPKGKLLYFSLIELKDSELGVKVIDFLFPLSATVENYSIIIPNKPILYVEGNIITKEVVSFLKEAKRNDIITINNIHTNFMNGYGCHRAIDPLIFKITK